MPVWWVVLGVLAGLLLLTLLILLMWKVSMWGGATTLGTPVTPRHAGRTPMALK